MLIADHVPSAQALRFDAGIGRRVPIHASAMGKMLLALTDDPAAEVAALGALERFTERTLTDPGALLAELDTIRRRGWSLNDGERDPGVRAVAVAIPGTGAARRGDRRSGTGGTGSPTIGSPSVVALLDSTVGCAASASSTS